MPVYRYRCNGCGREQEVLQTFAEAEAEPRPGCPFCPETMERVPSAVNSQFKGQGWTPKFYPNRSSK